MTDIGILRKTDPKVYSRFKFVHYLYDNITTNSLKLHHLLQYLDDCYQDKSIEFEQ